MPGVPTFAVTVAPNPIVAVADARAYGGIPSSLPDAQVQAFIDAALGFLDGPGGWLNRSLGAQTIACTLAQGWRGLRRPEPIVLAAGPVTGLVSVAGLSGSDSFGTPPYELDGDMLSICQPFGPTWGAQPAPIVVTYAAGSPAGVIAQVKPVICAMVAKQAAAAAVAGRDPSLRSESIPDTFSKSYGLGGPDGGMGAFDASTLAPIANLRRWS